MTVVSGSSGVNGSSIICAGNACGAVRSSLHAELQPSFGSMFPSSQSSLGVSIMRSPQRPGVQSGLHSALGLLEFSVPSSHISPGSRIPLPQNSRAQRAEHPSPGRSLPSSHSSPKSRVPLPQDTSSTMSGREDTEDDEDRTTIVGIDDCAEDVTPGIH